MTDPQCLLTAHHRDTGEQVDVVRTPLDVLRALSDARLLVCPDCGAELILKAGQVRQHHFAHLKLNQCGGQDAESESADHRAGKWRLFEHFQAKHPSATADLEKHIPQTGQRVDVFFAFPDGWRYALEFQQADNSIHHWRERHAKYVSAGIHDVWFLGTCRWHESRRVPFGTAPRWGAIPVPREAFNAQDGALIVSELEKAIADAEGILYFLDPNPNAAFLTIVLPQQLAGNTLRAFKYDVPFEECRLLEDGNLWTPLSPHLDDYWVFRQEIPLRLLAV